MPASGDGVAWPVLAFDFDLFPYVVREHPGVADIAESPETVDELVGVFDSGGTRWRVEFTGGVPGLVPDAGDPEEVRVMVRQAALRYPREFTGTLRAVEVDALSPAYLVRAVCDLVAE